MTALRRLTALALLALLLVLPTAAASVQAEGHGWWWRPQSGLMGVEIPPPPDVPDDGLLVERAPDGVTAISALRFTFSDDETDPVLTLTVASDQGGAAAGIAACPSLVRWVPQQAGRWDLAPAYDCEGARVDGVRAEDGSTWTWELARLLSPAGVLDLVLVDGTETPFRIAFEAPTASSVTVTRAPPPPPPAPDPPPPPATQGEDPPPAARDEPAFVPPPVRAETAPPPARPDGPAPEVAGPATTPPAPEAPVTQPGAAPATGPAGLTPLAAGLIGMIGALVLTDLLAAGHAGSGSRPWRSPPSTTGGIGRFARDRTDRPAALW